MLKMFIVRYPEQPVQVPVFGRISIGRADSNTIVLIESRVSRLHALIEWRDKTETFVIFDIGSVNGTFLNGEKIFSTNEYPLKDWDKIRIASAVFTVRYVNDPAEILHEFRATTERIHTQATQMVSRAELYAEISQPALSGTLEHLCPIDLFQMLESGRKTGNLTLVTPQGEGRFSVLDGVIATALFGNVHGEQAVFDTLALNKGTFVFVPGSSSSIHPVMNTPTTALLMEGCKRMDEMNAAG